MIQQRNEHNKEYQWGFDFVDKYKPIHRWDGDELTVEITADKKGYPAVKDVQRYLNVVHAYSSTFIDREVVEAIDDCKSYYKFKAYRKP